MERIGRDCATRPHPELPCPRLLQASVITAFALLAPTVIIDCRNKPGNDRLRGAPTPPSTVRAGFDPSILLSCQSTGDGGAATPKRMRGSSPRMTVAGRPHPSHPVMAGHDPAILFLSRPRHGRARCLRSIHPTPSSIPPASPIVATQAAWVPPRSVSPSWLLGDYRHPITGRAATIAGGWPKVLDKIMHREFDVVRQIRHECGQIIDVFRNPRRCGLQAFALVDNNRPHDTAGKVGHDASRIEQIPERNYPAPTSFFGRQAFWQLARFQQRVQMRMVVRSDKVGLKCPVRKPRCHLGRREFGQQLAGFIVERSGSGELAHPRRGRADEIDEDSAFVGSSGCTFLKSCGLWRRSLSNSRNVPSEIVAL